MTLASRKATAAAVWWRPSGELSPNLSDYYLERERERERERLCAENNFEDLSIREERGLLQIHL